MSRANRLRLLVLLGLVTLALYWPTTHQGFIVFDDPAYVSENPWVNQGMSWAAFRWAFTSSCQCNWHPLTWISHQADWACYGSFAGGHHLTNLLLHTLNTVLLFQLLCTLTANINASWIVAALFGWHPLHVESVAWIAERKDLLSTLCLIGTLWAYACYARARRIEPMKQMAEGRFPAWAYFTAAVAIFSAGLMCKPMLVTLPCLLLILDYWPLKRAADPLSWKHAAGWRMLFVEKLPFFVLAAIACGITLRTQTAAINGAEGVRLPLRALNAPAAYLEYLRQSLWPHPLCFFYPLPTRLPVAAGVAGALLLSVISCLGLRHRHTHPWLLSGWLWFLGSLIPVIGLVQVGKQAHADRYMYIPSIGLFVAAVWTGQTLLLRCQRGKQIAIGLSGTGLGACLLLTHHQLHFWKDDIDLMAHTLAHTKNNAMGYDIMGGALSNAGRVQEAIASYRESIRIDPGSVLPRLHLGVEFTNSGQLDEAAEQLAQALQLSPNSELVLNNLGVVRAQQGKYEDALAHFREAIRWDPNYPKSYHNAGMALQALGRPGEAVTNYTAALRLEPNSIHTLDRLAGLLATCPIAAWHQPDAAIGLARRAVAMAHDEGPDYLDTLATAYAAANQFTNAIAAGQRAIDVAKRNRMPWLVSKLETDLLEYRTGRMPESDWRQSPHARGRGTIGNPGCSSAP